MGPQRPILNGLHRLAFPLSAFRSPLLVTLAYYCLLILIASVLGGMLPQWLRLTHRRMELAVSLVAGVMLGVAVMHLLPHALASVPATGGPDRFLGVMAWMLAGFLAMFFVERFFCFHHHDAPAEESDAEHHHCDDPHHADGQHGHDITWSGATFGLTLHSVMAGVALAASVLHGQGASGSSDGATLAGFGAFLAILLHKPFDSMTIAMLMAKGGWSPAARCVVNGLFALAIPAGVVLFYVGAMRAHDPSAIGPALAFSAGVFLCISMSDLLPELQFHHHDRLKLSAALLIGLVLAYAAVRMERHTHPEAPAVESQAEVS